MNPKSILPKYIIVVLSLILGFLLLYTRFVNLGWGLPYPFHPDERNMAVAMLQLTCNFNDSGFKIQDCFNPHFFAYGQLPLYLGSLLIQLWHLGTLKIGMPVSFNEATLSLRFISAVSSILTVFVMAKIFFFLILNKKKLQGSHDYLAAIFVFVFSPALIQFAHFGTTESFLMLCYTTLMYLSLQVFEKKLSRNTYMVISGIVSGLAIATKLSSFIFLVLPVVNYLFIVMDHRLRLNKKTLLSIVKWLPGLLLLLITTLVCFVVGSPHNVISWHDFMGSIHYESDVATGAYVPFYTQQFTRTLPIIFQFTSVFPFALGIPITLLFLLGFIFLPLKKEVNMLRFSFLIYFLPTAIIFAKWTRFMAPAIPVMLVIAVLFLYSLYNILLVRLPKFSFLTKLLVLLLIVLLVYPGVRFLKIYQQDDVRLQASQWVFDHIPANATILSETGNVVDIPIATPYMVNPKSYDVISFDFYDLDANLYLQQSLKDYLQKVDYIFVPSRRIFANYTCTMNSKFRFQNSKCLFLQKQYPKLNEYYRKLFNGAFGFKKVAEFSILPDETAEETWSVFDHPVIRIYKKM